MKALYEKVAIDEQRSLAVRQYTQPYFDAPWHYHPEYELTYISHGYGRRFVGDHTELFTTGDLVLLGPELPHFWRSDDDFHQGTLTQQVEAIVVQFPASFAEQGLVTLPETQAVCQLLARARYGLRFRVAISQQLAPALHQLVTKTGLTQVLALLDILAQLTTDPDAYPLASDGYQLAPGAADTERLKRVLEFMLAHFREDIPLTDIAEVADMVPAAFCRYFKKRTRKSFIEYLTDLRVGYARKLLTTSNLTVGMIGLEAGFTNVSHFHRQFKRHTGMTPAQYQRVREKPA